ncbi:MAG: radical SAM protein [Methylococcales bacterium]|nr:radical SAM protein [Methylococcales bacterium]MBT7444646.1 radical SAM protein [Methylococcales bacterium]
MKIYDDLFSVKEERILEFCELIKETKLDIHWSASMRVADVNIDLLQEMKSAGCNHIGYGFESGSDIVLKSMNKRITQREIQRAIDLTEKVKIGIQANFIYGDPAETPETVKETNEFYRESCLDHIVHNDFVAPYPGSPIFDHCMKIGAITDKQHYYDTIHIRPRYNMTAMKRKDYQSNIEPIIQSTLAGMKYAENVRFFDADKKEFDHPYFENKHLLGVEVDCPHCKNQVDYVFPQKKKDIENPVDRYSMIAPIRYYCSDCHKRFLISRLPLIGMEEQFKLLAEQIDLLVKSQAEVIVGPIVQLPGVYLFDVLEANGLRMSELNIHSFLTLDTTMGGLHLQNLPIGTVNKVRVERYAGTQHLAIPTVKTEDFVQTLNEFGVPKAHILSLETPSLKPTAGAVEYCVAF